jgi:hypothetical protein
MKWLRDRFFSGPEGWYALSFSGMTAQFEQVCDAATANEQGLVGVFDRVGVDGPFGITAYGDACLLSVKSLPTISKRLVEFKVVNSGLVFEVVNSALVPSSGPFRVAAIAADGKRLVLSEVSNSGSGRTPSWLIDLHTVEVFQILGDPVTALAANLLGAFTNRTLRHIFVSIFADCAVLVLTTSRGGRFCRIEWNSSIHQISMQTVLAKSGGKRVPFVETPGPPSTGYRLSVAEWDNGSRAYLDSRGLLHLKSSDPTIPELTLALCDGAMAGWCANGMVFGPPYFTGEGADGNAWIVYSEVLCRFVMGLQ